MLKPAKEIEPPPSATSSSALEKWLSVEEATNGLSA
jgi:hypothetical protein